MHEFSLASSMTDIVLTEMRRHFATTVTKVTVHIGPTHQIVPEIFQSTFQAATQSTPIENAVLCIVKTPMSLCCDACGQLSDINEYQLICPLCNSNDVDIVGGDEFVISEIEMEVPDECPGDAQRV